MAADDSKEHQASGKRLADLRKKGTVLRSKDLTGGLVFIVAVIELIRLGSDLKDKLAANFVYSFDSIQLVLVNQDHLKEIICKILVSNFLFLLPVLLIMFVTVAISPFIFGGWNFTLQAVSFKFEKLNPITNLKNIFSPKRALGEILKSMLKAGVLLGVLIFFFISRKEELFALVTYPARDAIAEGYSILVDFVMLLSFALVFLVICDAILHYVQFAKQTKMSLQELKDEHKESEGSSDVKRRIRSAQLAILKQRLSQSVPKANVIVTNPTHYAVALKYDERKDRAPKVVAKGKGAVAQQIRYLAVSNGIPIYEAPALSRAIYHTTKLGGEIQTGLYMAVAIVLSYVRQLRSYQSGAGQAPNHVSEFELPEEFIYDE